MSSTLNHGTASTFVKVVARDWPEDFFLSLCDIRTRAYACGRPASWLSLTNQDRHAKKTPEGKICGQDQEKTRWEPLQVMKLFFPFFFFEGICGTFCVSCRQQTELGSKEETMVRLTLTLSSSGCTCSCLVTVNKVPFRCFRCQLNDRSHIISRRLQQQLKPHSRLRATVQSLSSSRHGAVSWT